MRSLRRSVPRIHRPDFLNIVESAHLGPEQVNHEITRVDQYPVTVRKTFDPGATIACFLEGAQQVIGERADVAVRTPRRHNKAIGESALILEVDEDDILGLVVVQMA